MTTDRATGGVGLAEASVVGDAPAPVVAPPRFRWDPVLVVAAVLVLVPTVVAMGSALRNPWAPTNDWALLELQVRRVGTGDTPLLGAWSRFGWQHPGPLPFYLMALPYRLVPAEHGLLFAAGFVNFLATLGCVAVAVRHPRARALVLLGGLAVVERGLGITQLSDPWNPTLPILPFALYALLCLELAVFPRRWTLAAAVGVASFVVQAHVGYAQPVVLLGATAVGLRWLDRRRRRTGDTVLPAGSLVPAAVVAAVAWFPVVLDQVAGTGNLGRIVRWSAGGDIGPGMGELTRGKLPLDRVAGALAWLLDPVGLWIGNVTPLNVFGYPLLGSRAWLLSTWVVVAVGGAVLIAWRAPLAAGYRRATLAAAALAGAGVVATLTDLLTARGAPVFWPFRWVAVVTLLVCVTLGFALAGVAARRAPAVDDPAWRPGRGAATGTVAAAGALAVIALPVVATVWGGSLGHQPQEVQSRAVLRLVPAIEAAAGKEPLVVANSKDMLSDVDLGLPVVLERAGIPWVERDDPRAAGQAGFALAPAAALDGILGYAVATGEADVVARSGTPPAGEPSDSELLLVRYGPTPP
jgi:hypothetical protein